MMNKLKLNIYKNIEFLIKIETGPDAGKLYRITPPHITLGRDRKCQIVLTDPKVSRRQCMIKFDNDITCVDLSGRETTLVNGKPGNNKSLKPGDIISFGTTSLRFITKTSENAKPRLAEVKVPPHQNQKQNKGGKQKFNLFLATIGLMAVIFTIYEEDPISTKKEELVTQEDLNKQAEESQQRIEKITESRKEKRKASSQKYLYSVQNHFIMGFRDFQNGQYKRALDSFGTTIATDQNHTKAQIYSRMAKKKRSNLIETHLQDGRKYREKLMYNRCASEFEKAILLMNNVNSKKYKLAKTQMDECRLLNKEGF